MEQVDSKSTQYLKVHKVKEAYQLGGDCFPFALLMIQVICILQQ